MDIAAYIHCLQVIRREVFLIHLRARERKKKRFLFREPSEQSIFVGTGALEVFPRTLGQHAAV
jgi:hypothetical protein